MSVNDDDNNNHLRERLKIIGTIVFIIVGLIMPSIVPFVRADSINLGVFPLDSKPYGVTYEDWTVKWWQWLLSIPKDSNPANDDTGRNCAQKQNGSVWFFPGTTGGSAERTCTIPAGKAILVSILNGECSYADSPTAKTESDLRSCALASDAGVTNLKATIDGKDLKDVDKYRITTRPFNMTLVDNNIFGVQAGRTIGVADGWWVFLNPLSPGKHEIHTIGVLVNPTVAPTATSTNPRFISEVTYHLMVQ